MSLTEGGKRSCKYYNACGSTENCKRCESFKKESKKDERINMGKSYRKA